MASDIPPIIQQPRKRISILRLGAYFAGGGLGLLLLLALLGSVLGNRRDSSSSTKYNPPNYPIGQSPLVVENAARPQPANPPARKPSRLSLDPGWTFTTGEYAGYIEGTVTNETGREYRYAQIMFDVFDESDARIGTALANINNLSAGQRWNFKALVTEPKRAKRARLSKLEGF